ncbi:DUF6882 domain-containing protein [Paludisphaera soli]|uniref:DUF6882 domain-containing protein n=1 Tax=Paludisphaera soli TaxID=2712865 RepID=UPI0013EAA227|nr:DUF6882 domain-containing protein [Paludisphaera soli]
MDEAMDLEELIKAGVAELQMKTRSHRDGWGFGKFERWCMDTQKGELRFTNKDGFTATCPAQAIGTYNRDDGGWLWAWANPSLPDDLKRDVFKVKAYGEERGLPLLTEPRLNLGDEARAWELAALAVKLNEAQGAYRCLLGSTAFFVSFGEVRLSKAPGESPNSSTGILNHPIVRMFAWGGLGAACGEGLGFALIIGHGPAADPAQLDDPLQFEWYMPLFLVLLFLQPLAGLVIGARIGLAYRDRWTRRILFGGPLCGALLAIGATWLLRKALLDPYNDSLKLGMFGQVVGAVLGCVAACLIDESRLVSSAAVVKSSEGVS